MNSYLKLIRVKQWVKNGFVLAPLFFSYSFLDFNLVTSAIFALLSFCFISSFVYILNDIFDRDSDKFHTKKKFRPIASGKISIRVALIVAFISLLLSAFFAFKANILIVIGIYLVVNIFYTLYLKKIVFVDVGIIAFGFFLRLLAGANSISQPLSSWIVLTTLFLSLLLGFSKRRSELLSSDKKHRKTLNFYSESLLNNLILMSTTLTIITYSLYIVETKGVYDLIYLLNVPFVIYSLFRYLSIVFNDDGGDDTAELLFSDKPLLISIILWFIVMVLTF